MSSYRCFQHFQLAPYLDKVVSGIPNAITSLINRQKRLSGERGPAFAITGNTDQVGGDTVLMFARTLPRIKNRPSRRKPMSNSKDAVRKILYSVKADKRTSLTAPEGKLVCDAYGIPVPKEGVAKSAAEASKIATGMGFPVVMKIVSPDILHKTEAGGVMVG